MAQTPPFTSSTSSLPRADAARVAVVLVNWNGWRDTIECLESVLRCSGCDLSIVVCDNASTDGSVGEIVDWLARRSKSIPHLVLHADVQPTGPGLLPAVTILRSSENLGFAGGNNLAIRLALQDPSIDFIWILNNDTVVDEHALVAMVRCAGTSPTAGIMGSKVLYFHDPIRIQAAGGGRLIRTRGLTKYARGGEVDDESDERQLPLDYITGCSMLVRRDLIEQVGLLAEEYFLYSEEVDWCLRARAEGWQLAYCAASRVYHKDGRSTVPRSPFADYYSVRSSLLLTRKFSPALVPVVFTNSLLRCLLPKVLRWEWERVRAVWRAYRDFIRPPGPLSTSNGVGEVRPIPHPAGERAAS